LQRIFENKWDEVDKRIKPLEMSHTLERKQAETSSPTDDVPFHQQKVNQRQRQTAEHRLGQVAQTYGRRRAARTVLDQGLDEQKRLDQDRPARPVEAIRDKAVEPSSSALRPARTRQAVKTIEFPGDDFTFSFDRWTDNHKDWAKEWRIPLSYSRTTVDKEDISRLDEGEYLNDNLITFYLKYLHDTMEKEQPELARRVYFHNTFFYEKLKRAKGKGINYDGVKKWTAKIDILSYDYIVVPVNEYQHWWVAIICNAPRLTPLATGEGGNGGTTADATDRETKAQGRPASEDTVAGRGGALAAHPSPPVALSPVDLLGEMSISTPREQPSTPAVEDRTGEVPNANDVLVIDQFDDIDDTKRVTSDIAASSPSRSKKQPKKAAGPPPKKFGAKDPRIVTLDSLGNAHSPQVIHLKQYLLAEMEERKGLILEDVGPLGLTAKGIPQQSNHWDCGVFLLGYVQAFIKDPDTFVGGLLQRETPAWDVDAPALRNSLRQLIFDLQKKQQDEEVELRKRKAKAKAKREQDRKLDLRGVNSERDSEDIASPVPYSGKATPLDPNSHSNSPSEMPGLANGGTLPDSTRSPTSPAIVPDNVSVFVLDDGLPQGQKKGTSRGSSASEEPPLVYQPSPDIVVSVERDPASDASRP